MKNILIILVLFVGCVKETKVDYNTTVRDFKPIVMKAFDEADKLMELDIDIIDDGQDPDASKCICKGTGRIVQGDGHVTECRYHKKSTEEIVKASIDPIVEYVDNNKEEMKKRIDNLEQENILKDGKIKELEEQLNVISRQLIELKSTLSQIEQKGFSAKKEDDIQLIFLTAEWCSPCRQQKAELEKLKTEGYDIGTSSTSKIRILDVDKDRAEYEKYRGATASIPVNVLLVNGEVKQRIVGFINKEKVIEYLRNN